MSLTSFRFFLSQFVDSQSKSQSSPRLQDADHQEETAVEARKFRGQLVDVALDLIRLSLVCVRHGSWSMDVNEWKQFREMIQSKQLYIETRYYRMSIVASKT